MREITVRVIGDMPEERWISYDMDFLYGSDVLLGGEIENGEYHFRVLSQVVPENTDQIELDLANDQSRTIGMHITNGVIGCEIDADDFEKLTVVELVRKYAK